MKAINPNYIQWLQLNNQSWYLRRALSSHQLTTLATSTKYMSILRPDQPIVVSHKLLQHQVSRVMPVAVMSPKQGLVDINLLDTPRLPSIPLLVRQQQIVIDPIY